MTYYCIICHTKHQSEKSFQEHLSVVHITEYRYSNECCKLPPNEGYCMQCYELTLNEDGCRSAHVNVCKPLHIKLQALIVQRLKNENTMLKRKIVALTQNNDIKQNDEKSEIKKRKHSDDV